jgi:hypothetical protein
MSEPKKSYFYSDTISREQYLAYHEENETIWRCSFCQDYSCKCNGDSQEA